MVVRYASEGEQQAPNKQKRKKVVLYLLTHHHHLSSFDGMVEAADTNLRQVVLFFMSCWISFGSRSRSFTMLSGYYRIGNTLPASLKIIECP